MSYGMEVWSWREGERIERMQERYLRWVLGMRWKTPGYIIGGIAEEEIKGQSGEEDMGF